MYRLAHGVLRRLGAFTVHNARRKQQLLGEWRILQARRQPDAVMPMVELNRSLSLLPTKLMMPPSIGCRRAPYPGMVGPVQLANGVVH